LQWRSGAHEALQLSLPRIQGAGDNAALTLFSSFNRRDIKEL
jgi:hypothetical protein